MKKISYSVEARSKLYSGIETLYSAVKVTLGPKGRNAVYFDVYGKPQITKDGIAVATQVDNLSCEYANLGACILRQAASKTADIAGDGTTTTTILAHDMFKLGLEELSKGTNPVDLKKGMESTRDAILQRLDELAQPCSTIEKVRNVATISCNNDTGIGHMIAEAISNVGNDGVVTIEDSPNENTYLEYTEGMQFDRGYLSKYFANKKQKCILDNCQILVTDKKVTNVTEVAQILADTAEKGKPLLIMAPDFEDSVIAGIATANKSGQIKACCVKAPGLGDLRKELILDICAATGANLITDDLSLDLSKATLADLGSASQVIVTKNTTTIVEGKGEASEIDSRIEDIRDKLSGDNSEYQREKLNERLAKLNGGIVVIRVGAVTEVELIEKKARIEDSLQATRAAIEEGIVPGGGLTLAQIVKGIEGNKTVIEACKGPLRQLLINAGNEDLEEKILDSDFGVGYNINTLEAGDLVELGVIDPVKVTKQALINAVSVASMLLTTEVALIDSRED